MFQEGKSQYKSFQTSPFPPLVGGGEIDALVAEFAFCTWLNPQVPQVKTIADLINDAKEEIPFAQSSRRPLFGTEALMVEIVFQVVDGFKAGAGVIVT